MALSSFQSAYHWLQYGGGRKLIIWISVIILVMVGSLALGWRREHGPKTEYVIQEALIGRSIGEGSGFTTRVNFGQSVAVLEERGKLEFEYYLPDLHHPPLYPLALGTILQLAGEEFQAYIFQDPVTNSIMEQPAFFGDRFLLGCNILFLWLALILAYLLGRRLFSETVGLVVLLAYFFSAGTWSHVTSLSGITLLSSIILLLFHLALNIELDRGSKWKVWIWSVGLGVCSALAFLCEYPFFVVLFPVVGFVVLRVEGIKRWPAGFLVIVSFLVVVGPWVMRNMELTGHPVGLAQHEIMLWDRENALEPHQDRSALSPDGPEFKAYRVVYKFLTGVEMQFSESLWTDGAFFLAGFFILSIIYRFRRPETDHMRWLAVAMLGTLLFLFPVLSSWESERTPSRILAPVLILFGVGFFNVLLQSTRSRGYWETLAWYAGFLLVFTVPFFRLALERRGLPFHYPPYWPPVFVQTREFKETLTFGTGMISDVPAGMAWYAGERVWAQPTDYEDFARIALHEGISVQLFSADLMDRPFLRELVDLDIDERFRRKSERNWSSVYIGLIEGEMPRFYPLKEVYQISDNMFLCYNADRR